MKKLALCCLLLTFLNVTTAQIFTEVEFLDNYTKKVNPLFGKKNQSISLSLIKKQDYFETDTLVSYVAVFEVVDLREEVVGETRSIGLGNVGSIWGVGASGGVITNFDKKRGMRTFTVDDLRGVSKRALTLLNFVNQNQNADRAKGLNMNIDSTMSVGILIDPDAGSTSSNPTLQFSWVVLIDDAEFEIDYHGGMVLLKKLAFYSDYLESLDPNVLLAIEKLK